MKPRPSHLPVIADSSHGVGFRRHVVDDGLAAVAAGADGLLVEGHPQPDTAVSDSNQTFDSNQTLYFDQAARLIEGGRQFHTPRQVMTH